MLPAGAVAPVDTKNFRDIKMTPSRDMQSESQGELRADARELMDLLNIRTLVSALRKSKESGTDSTQLSRTIQHARMLCLWKIFIASQEVRKVEAMIDFDLARSNEALDSLTAKRDMTRNMINTFNFLQSGTLGTIKNATSFPGPIQTTNAARQEMAMTFFGTSIALATTNLLMPSLWRHSVDPPPNILVHVFDQNSKPNDADQSYLWKFMNSPIPGSDGTLTRRQILIKHWESFAGLDSKDELRLKKLSGSSSESEELSASIKVTAQRIALLQDLKTHFEEFDIALYELHKVITFN